MFMCYQTTNHGTTKYVRKRALSMFSFEGSTSVLQLLDTYVLTQI